MRKYVSEETINKYSSGKTSKIGYIGEKLVAMVSYYLLLIKKIKIKILTIIIIYINLAIKYWFWSSLF